MHACAARLFPQRFGEGEHVGFGGIIIGHQWAGLKRGRGGDVQHAAALVGEHLVPEMIGELDERAHVEVDHAELRGEIGGGERASVAVARIVHEHIEPTENCRSLRDYAFDLRRVRDIECEGAARASKGFTTRLQVPSNS